MKSYITEMTYINQENILLIRRLNDYEITNDNVNDIICVICHKLMINAHNAPCGCRFCWECILMYLDGKDKHCPGNTDDCRELFINIDKNIYTDHPINRKISKLIVKCPESTCKFKDELRKLEDHMRLCSARVISCPFVSVGCKHVNILPENLKEHLLLENDIHTKLLMDCIDILHNEVGLVKKEIIELKETNSNLKLEVKEIRLEVELKNLKIEQQNKEIADLNQDIVALRNVDRNLQDSITSTSTQLSTIMVKYPETSEEVNQVNDNNISLKNNNSSYEDLLNELKIKIENNDKHLSDAIKKLDIYDEKIILLNEKWEHIISNIDKINYSLGVEHKVITTTVQNFSDEYAYLTLKSNHSDKSIENIENQIKNIKDTQETQNWGQFLWIIDKWNEKRTQAQNNIKTTIDSEPFYSHKNGYKMSLRVLPDGVHNKKGNYVFLGFRILRGHFDEALQWPFRHDVIFELVNQDTGAVYKSKTVTTGHLSDNVNRNKPQKDHNEFGLGYDFIKIVELSSNNSLCKNDQVCIRCTVRIIN